MIVRLFETGIAYVSELICDDDSTTRAQVQHSHQAKIDAGIMKDSKWPVNKRESMLQTMANYHYM